MRRAVLVACGAFKDPSFASLSYSASDLDTMRSLLSDRDLCHFDEVVALEDCGFLEVRRAIEKAAKLDSAYGDAILFYYSGHGKLDRDGTLSLLMSDSESDYLTTTSLQSEDLKRLFNLSHATQKVMILDCCYSGAIGSRQIKGSLADAVDPIANASGVFVLTASAKLAPAFEVPDLNGSALTTLIERGIRTGEAASEGARQITLNEVASYVRKHVPRYGQEPKVWDIGGAGEMIFAWRPRIFDDAWARTANRAMTAIANDGELDDDTYDAVRSAIRHRADPDQAPKLDLIDRLATRSLSLSAFVREWDRLNAASAPAAGSPDPRFSGIAESTTGQSALSTPVPSEAPPPRFGLSRFARPALAAAAGFAIVGVIAAGIADLVRETSIDRPPAGPSAKAPAAPDPVQSKSAASPGPTWLFKSWAYGGDCNRMMRIWGDARGLQVDFNDHVTEYRIAASDSDLVQTAPFSFQRRGSSVQVVSNASPPFEPFVLAESSRCRN